MVIPVRLFLCAVRPSSCRVPQAEVAGSVFADRTRVRPL